MAVLTLFKCLTTVDADGLLWADMDAAEADGTVVADESDKTALRADRRQTVLRTDRTQTYVLHWANANAGVTAYTLIGVHFRAQGFNHTIFYGRATEEP